MCSLFIIYSLYHSSLQINLPDSVTKRIEHSMSTYYISKKRFWIVVTGGYCEINLLKKALSQVAGSDITVIIELGISSCDILLLVIIIMFTGVCILYKIKEY